MPIPEKKKCGSATGATAGGTRGVVEVKNRATAGVVEATRLEGWLSRKLLVNPRKTAL